MVVVFRSRANCVETDRHSEYTLPHSVIGTVHVMIVTCTVPVTKIMHCP